MPFHHYSLESAAVGQMDFAAGAFSVAARPERKARARTRGRPIAPAPRDASETKESIAMYVESDGEEVDAEEIDETQCLLLIVKGTSAPAEFDPQPFFVVRVATAAWASGCDNISSHHALWFAEEKCCYTSSPCIARF
jgi:hypothetical protein